MLVMVSAIMNDGLDRKGERWLEAVEHCGRSGNGGNGGNGGSDGNSARKEEGGRC
jgi:hypothetical protein